MYDLTSVLTTIAACSASIVAIIGGFIASRLISINADRDEVNTRLSETEEELSLHQEECAQIQNGLDEDDALDFVKNRIKNIVDCDPLEEVYKEEDRPRLQKDILQHYWDKASSVYAFIHANVGNCLSDTRLLNADGIPTTFATHFTDDFEYTVCKAILKELDRRCNPHKLVWPDLPDMDIATWYSQDMEKVNELKSKIALLELQKKQLTARSTALKKPRGMKTGLFLFALFTATNIIFPLCLSPFRVESYCCYLRTKTACITLFAGGLILIIIYLVYLLHWKKNQTNTGT